MKKNLPNRIFYLMAITLSLTVVLPTAKGQDNDELVPFGKFQTTWKKILAGSFDQGDQATIEAIIDDLLWYVSEHSHPDTVVLRPRGKKIGEEHGLDILQRIILTASHGESKSQAILIGLLRIPGHQVSLETLQRSAFDGPSAIDVGDDIIPEFVARTIDEHGKELDVVGFSEFLIEYTLQHPEQGALTVSVTAILAKPSLWQGQEGITNRQKIRDFYLLMSLHPSPRVRLHAFVGLAAFTKSDPVITRHLQEELSSVTRKNIDFVNYWPRLIFVLNHLSEHGILSEYIEKWQTQLFAVYQRWDEDRFSYQLQDRGDYRWERTASATAGQALLWSVGQPAIDREFLVSESAGSKETLARESIATGLKESPIYSLFDGWGAALDIVKTIQFSHESSTPGLVFKKHLFDGQLIKGPDPKNLWLMDTLTIEELDELFTALRKFHGADLYFGNYKTLLAWIKYKLLGANYRHAVIRAIDFREQMVSKQNVESAIRLVETDERNRLNSEFEEMGLKALWNNRQTTQQKGPYGGKGFIQWAHDLEAFFPPQPVLPSQSIFTTPIETLFAIDALFKMGEFDLARQTLINLFPQRWDLTLEETTELRNRLSQDYGHFFHSVQITESMKLKSLDELIKRLFLIENSANARRFLIHWIAQLTDTNLQAKMRTRYLSAPLGNSSQSCQAALVRPLFGD